MWFLAGKACRGDWANPLLTDQEMKPEGGVPARPTGSQAGIEAHLHPPGFSSSTTSSDNSSNAWSRLGLSGPIKCFPSTLCFPWPKFITIIFSNQQLECMLNTASLILLLTPWWTASTLFRAVIQLSSEPVPQGLICLNWSAVRFHASFWVLIFKMLTVRT